MASLGAQAACQNIYTHFGILTVHDNHKLGLFCHHKLIDVHELCIWCESQGQQVAIYLQGHFLNRLKIIANFTKIDILHSWPWIFLNGLCMKYSSWNMTSYLAVRKKSRCFADIFYALNVFAIDFIDEQPGTVIGIHIPSKFCCVGLSQSYRDLFEMNMNCYDLRDNKKLVQPRVKTALYGLRTSRYYEPTHEICCPFNIKTAWMFMISENYCLHGMDRIAHVLFACKQDAGIS